MKTLLELKQELISVNAQMGALDIDSADFSAENWDKLEAEQKKLSMKIKQLEMKQVDELNIADSANQAVTPVAPIAPASNTSHVTGVTTGFDQMKNKGYECAGELLADHVASELYGAMPNDNAEGFRANRYQNYLDSQNIKHAAGTASTLTDGLEIMPDLLPGVKEYGQGEGVDQVLQAFSPLSTSRKEVDIFINEDTYNFDGLVTARVSEGGTLTSQTFSNKLERFRLHKVGVFTKVTEEDLQNVPLLETRYMQRAPEVINTQKVIDIIAGDGAQKPIGFTSAQNTAAVSINRAGATAISNTDLANMDGRYKRQDGNGLYFANQSCIPQLELLKDDSGALLWRPNRNDGLLDSSIHGTLKGRPLVISEDMEALGTKGDIALVNPAGYIFANHTSGTRFAQSMHFYFDADAMAFRWLAQYGGRPVFTSAYTPRNGSTLSHFVMLNA